MGKQENEEREESLGRTFADYLGYYYFEGFGKIGKILWVMCLPFIILKRAVGFILDLIF